MAWIKRNLFFAVGGTIALLLLGAAVFYNVKSWSHNSAAFDKLNEIYGQLQKLASDKPGPGNAKINNIQAAKEQELEVRKWIDQTGKYFQPVPAIPDTPQVSSEAFASALRRTIDQLNHEAETANVQLPPKYGFSFEAQRTTVRFAPGSLGPLAVQLGQVKTISEILFAARVISLEGIQRVRVSEDDATGSQSDYIAESSVTNEFAVLTPYAVTFPAFTPELAAVLAGFAASPNGFIVKGLNVSPAGATASMGETAMPGGYSRGPGAYPGGSPGLAAAAGKGGPTSFLKEQLLRVTMEVVIVKPFPKK